MTNAPTNRKAARQAARENIARAKARKRAARIVAPVAFAGTEDAHRLDGNPNRGKRHGLRASTNEPRTSNRHRNEPRIELRTTLRGMPSLGVIRSKNIPGGLAQPLTTREGMRRRMAG